MSILALDLGTKTGWAWGDGHTVISGTWDFSSKRNESQGFKYLRFEKALNETVSEYCVEQIFFEEVRRHAGTSAAHVYGAFKGRLEAWCANHVVEYQSVPVREIKKFWTGKGNADKQAMLAAAVSRGFHPIDDNEADALAILHLKGGASAG